jgi:succinate dehydrogenase / fumarate reductase iron-sulfur subunit
MTTLEKNDNVSATNLPPVPEGATMVTLKIARFNPEDGKGQHWDSFQVPALPSDRMLNLLLYVKGYLDGTLTFRRSCAHGVCGSDAMRINGVNRLACKILMKDMLPKDGKPVTITIEPIKGLPVEKDLVVDMEPFFDAFRAVKPFLITTGNEPTRERIQSQADRARFDDTTKCILCACCTTSCPVLERRQLLRSRCHRQRAPVHLRFARRGRFRAPGHPQRQGGRVALPHDLQLHRRLPARHRGHEGHPGSQARSDHAPLLIS